MSFAVKQATSSDSIVASNQLVIPRHPLFGDHPFPVQQKGALVYNTSTEGLSNQIYISDGTHWTPVSSILVPSTVTLTTTLVAIPSTTQSTSTPIVFYKFGTTVVAYVGGFTITTGASDTALLSYFAIPPGFLATPEVLGFIGQAIPVNNTTSSQVNLVAPGIVGGMDTQQVCYYNAQTTSVGAAFPAATTLQFPSHIFTYASSIGGL